MSLAYLQLILNTLVFILSVVVLCLLFRKPRPPRSPK